MNHGEYCMPRDIHDIFKVGETQWYAKDYCPELEMDNVRAMEWFMEYAGITDEDIVSAEDTQIIIKHSEFSHYLRIDSGGLGDFFSHGFDVSIVKPEDMP